MSKSKSLQKMIQESPEAIKKYIKALRGEADDAVTKLGSGKNLAALQEAQEDLIARGGSKIDDVTPSPTVFQDDLAKSSTRGDGFVLKGKPQSKDFTMVPEESGLPIPYKPNDVSIVPKQATGLIDDMVGGLTKGTDDIIETALVVPQAKQATTASQRLLDRIPKAASAGTAGLGAIGAIGAMLSGDEENIQSPVTQSQPPTINNPIIQPEQAQSPEGKILQQALTQAQSQPIVNQATIPESIPTQPEQPLTEEDLLRQAQQSDAQRELMNTLIRAGVQAGSAISGTKADYSGVDSLDKMRKSTDMFQENIKLKQTKQQMEKAQNELNDSNKLRDPNSAISQQMRSALTQAGYPVNKDISAQNLKDMGVNIYNLLGQKQATEAMVTARLASKSASNEDTEKKFVQSLRKEMSTGVIGKQYANYLQADRIGQSISKFRQNPDGYKDYATLMGGLKALQGDESVVREAEVRMGVNAASAFTKAENSIQRLMTGKMITDTQRKQMEDTISILAEVGKQTFLNVAAPILEQAQREGIDQTQLLPFSLSSKEQKSSVETYTPQQEAGISAFMQAKNISREEAIQRLKKGKRL